MSLSPTVASQRSAAYISLPCVDLVLALHLCTLDFIALGKTMALFTYSVIILRAYKDQILFANMETEGLGDIVRYFVPVLLLII